MFEFPFFCPACQTEANATADPVSLLFGGAPDLAITCRNCDVIHRAVIEYGAVGQSIKLMGTLEPEGEDIASE